VEERCAGPAAIYGVTVIEAGGGVVWRSTKRGAVEVVLIRSRRDGHWELPKGKRHRRETLLECALREVHEETGVRCVAGDPLGGSQYRDRRGRPKSVTYFAMQPIGGRLRTCREADRVEWVDLATAGEWLTKPRELTIVANLDHTLTRVFAGSYSGRSDTRAG
jgi:8-oxo-dGTP pyrophosphatase MutT (NUDIX family)